MWLGSHPNKTPCCFSKSLVFVVVDMRLQGLVIQQYLLYMPACPEIPRPLQSPTLIGWHGPPRSARRTRGAGTLRTIELPVWWRHHHRPAEASWTGRGHSHWTCSWTRTVHPHRAGAWPGAVHPHRTGTWTGTVHPHWTGTWPGTVHPRRIDDWSGTGHPHRIPARAWGGHSHWANTRTLAHHPHRWLHWVPVTTLRSRAILRTTMRPTLHRRGTHCIARPGTHRWWTHWSPWAHGHSHADRRWRKRS